MGGSPVTLMMYVKDVDAAFSAGLGLAFCKLAVEAHGGTIGVSDAQPTGSVFAFELPVGPSQ